MQKAVISMAALTGTGTLPLVLTLGWTVVEGFFKPKPTSVWEVGGTEAAWGRAWDLGKIDLRNVCFHAQVKVTVNPSSSL